MKQLVIVIKPFQARAVLDIVGRHEVEACTVDEVKGYGRQKNYLERYRGSEYNLAFLPKVEICVWVEDETAELLANEIAAIAHTGLMGDGKIFFTQASWLAPLDF